MIYQTPVCWINDLLIDDLNGKKYKHKTNIFYFITKIAYFIAIRKSVALWFIRIAQQNKPNKKVYIWIGIIGSKLIKSICHCVYA